MSHGIGTKAKTHLSTIFPGHNGYNVRKQVRGRPLKTPGGFHITSETPWTVASPEKHWYFDENGKLKHTTTKRVDVRYTKRNPVPKSEEAPPLHIQAAAVDFARWLKTFRL